MAAVNLGVPQKYKYQSNFKAKIAAGHHKPAENRVADILKVLEDWKAISTWGRWGGGNGRVFLDGQTCEGSARACTVLRLVVFCARLFEVLLHSAGPTNHFGYRVAHGLVTPSHALALCNNFLAIRGVDWTRFGLAVAP
jgi:hypothetical protein